MKWIVGYELTDDYARISYYRAGMKEPETVDPSMGSQIYEIPLVIATSDDAEGALVGAEALRSGNSELILHDHLYSLAKGKDTREEGERLLTLFIRKSLRLIDGACTPEDIEHIAFTMEELRSSDIRLIRQLTKNLKIPRENVTIQDYSESFYAYVTNQSQELRLYAVGLFHFDKTGITGYELLIHKNSFPKVVTVRKTGEIPFMYETTDDGTTYPYQRSLAWSLPDDDGVVSMLTDRQKDSLFLDYVKEMVRTKIFSSVFLTGDAMDTKIYGDSLKLLCRGRRVFSGKNLYVKGACYQAVQNGTGNRGTEFLYMGKHKITTNIGMNVLRNGHREYFGIISGGINWYDAVGSCEFLLDNEDCMEIIISAIDKSEEKTIRIPLDGLPKRPPKTTRIRLDIQFTGARECKIHAQDVGFGEWFPSGGAQWTERIKL